jgi:16S rRNA (cytosine967-C5)-methyltransferase
LAKKLFSSVGVEVPSIAQDGAHNAVVEGAWDVVLLDAPCSGSGTFRRHPELKWRLRPEHVTERAQLQRSLIDRSFRLVAPGGALLYSTCSVEPEENEAHFVEPPAGFEPVPLDIHLPFGAPTLATRANGVLLRPQELCDGFTIHALRRVG